jgi:hypothetical protein
MAKKATTPKNASAAPEKPATPPQPPETAPASSDPTKAPQEPKAKATKQEAAEPKDPLLQQQEDLEKELAALYETLVEQVKAVAADGTKTTEIAEQYRAGAVQFLRQCNTALMGAQQLIETIKSCIAQNNKVLQGIEEAKADLEKRAEKYRLLTNKGQKNVQ